MNKFGQLFIIIIFLILATLLVEGLYLTPTADVTTGIITESGGLLSLIANSISGFWKIMSFQVEGLPVFINLLVFYPLSVMVFFMLIDLVRG
jgi:hypothetical protein